MTVKQPPMTRAERRVWEEASGLQRIRNKSQVGPSFRELAKACGISRTAVIYAVRSLVLRGLANHDPQIARSLWITKLAPKNGHNNGSAAAD